MAKNKNNQAIWSTRIKKNTSPLFQKVGGSIDVDKKLYKVAGIAHRPFQGWRYLTQEKVPQDIFSDKNNNEIPSSMMAELNEFGVL